jgi:hypothetical protein
MVRVMDKGKFVNLVKETELGLYRANKQAKELGKLPEETERLLKNILAIEQAVERSSKLGQELSEQLKQRQVVGQANELFKQLDSIEKDLKNLLELRERAAPFVESHRTRRLYAFGEGANATNFARRLFEMFSVQEILFKPRFIGAIDFNKMAADLKLKKSDKGLILQPKDLKPFVKAMAEKKFSSNISLEAQGLKLVWQDRKTIAVEADSEKLFRLDRLCNELEGKCLEK